MTNNSRRSRYFNFPEAQRAYAEGQNVTLHLQHQLGVQGNTPAIIEMAYDIQAGSYIAYASEQHVWLENYCAEMAGILAPYIRDDKSVLDIGCGELTTLSHLVNCLETHNGPLLAFDISWSRLHVGRSYASSRMQRHNYERLSLFSADIDEIPLPDRSIDVVISSHALEPNHGRERQLLSEILRVTRRYAILFEPSYEINSPHGRARMEKLGYVRGLPATATELGATVIEIIPLTHVANPQNPTAALILETPSSNDDAGNDPLFCDPGSSSPLIRHDNYFFSPERGVSYAIIEGLPILRSATAVLTSALGSEAPR